MSKTKRKKLEIILVVIMLISIIFNISISNVVFATDFNTEKYKPNSTDQVSDAGKLENIGNIIIGTVRTVGSLISVIVLIILGIKYIMGSAEEKAEYKKTMMPYVIGALLVFGITNLLAILSNLTKNLL
ncbi:MAG: hypothetical protein HFJ40_08570 [Clostridia bacterium]|nr:hypothetical protein [Clostridia bacterium]